MAKMRGQFSAEFSSEAVNLDRSPAVATGHSMTTTQSVSAYAGRRWRAASPARRRWGVSAKGLPPNGRDRRER